MTMGGGQDEVLVSMHDVRFRSRLLQLLIQAYLPRDDKLPIVPQQLSLAVEMITRHHLLVEPVATGFGPVRGASVPEPPFLSGNGTSTECPTNGSSYRKLAAIDSWADRLDSLLLSPVVENRALAACLLGLTCKECLQSRFLECYTGWFTKLLTVVKSIEPPFVRAAACAALCDLLVRLGSLIDFPGVRRDGSALVSKLVVPLLQLLRDVQLSGIWLEAVDLVCAILNTFPLCLRSSFDKVEALLVAMIMNTNCKSSLKRRCAKGLGLLPRAVGDSNTWSLLIRRVLVAINSELDVAFAGLEDPASAEVAMAELLPRQQEISPLGGPAVAADAAAVGDGETPFWQRFVPRVSALFHTLEYMLSSPYASPVPVPLRSMIGLIARVLAVDGSRPSGTSSLGGQASLSQQASLCAELPVLHAGALNLLSVALRGARSQLLPVGGEIARLMSDCLRRSATLPDDKRTAAFTFKIHLYYVITEFLYAMGAGGMVLTLAPVLVGIAISDLRVSGRRGGGGGGGGSGGGMMKLHQQIKANDLLPQGPAGISFPIRQAPLSTNTSGWGAESAQRVSIVVPSLQPPHLQSARGAGFNGRHNNQTSALLARKRKEPGGIMMLGQQLHDMPDLVGASVLFSEEGGGSASSVMAALYVAVLEVLEALLTVGGSMLPERWRSEVDVVVVNVAMGVCLNAGVGVDDVAEAGDCSTEGVLGGIKAVTPALRIAACKALLASVLAPRGHRPPFLHQALTVFRRCRCEAGTELSRVCAHALLACEPLLHPRALPHPARISAVPSASPVSSSHGKGFMASNCNLLASKTGTANYNKAASGKAGASERWIDSQHHPSNGGDPWADLDSWLGYGDDVGDMERAAFGLAGLDIMDASGAFMKMGDSLLGKGDAGNLETSLCFGNVGFTNQQTGADVTIRGSVHVGRGLGAPVTSPRPVYPGRFGAAGESKDIMMPEVSIGSRGVCKAGDTDEIVAGGTLGSGANPQELFVKTATSGGGTLGSGANPQELFVKTATSGERVIPVVLGSGLLAGSELARTGVAGGRMVDQAGAEVHLRMDNAVELGPGFQTTGAKATTGDGDAAPGSNSLFGMRDAEPSGGGGGDEGGGVIGVTRGGGSQELKKDAIGGMADNHGGNGSEEVNDAYKTGCLGKHYAPSATEGCPADRAGPSSAGTASLPMRLGVDVSCELMWSQGSAGKDKTPSLVSPSPSMPVTSVSVSPHANDVYRDDASIVVAEHNGSGSHDIGRPSTVMSAPIIVERPSAVTGLPGAGLLPAKDNLQSKGGPPQPHVGYQEVATAEGSQLVEDYDSDGPMPDIVDGDPDEIME